MQLLVMVAISLGLMLLAMVATAVMTFAGVDVKSPEGLRWIQTLTSVLTFAVPVLLMTAIYYKGSAREYYGCDWSGHMWGVAAAGVVSILLLAPAIELIGQWNEGWDLGTVGEMLHKVQEETEGILQDLLATDTVGGLVSNLLVVALVAAVCEELFFRCGMQNLLQRWFGNQHVAILVTAVIFSLVHGELFSFMPRLVLGILLGYLYVYGRSPLPNMLAHFVNNSVVVVLYWLVARGVLDIDPEAPVDFAWPVTLGCTLAAVALLWVMLSDKKQKNSTL